MLGGIIVTATHSTDVLGLLVIDGQMHFAATHSKQVLCEPHLVHLGELLHDVPKAVPINEVKVLTTNEILLVIEGLHNLEPSSPTEVGTIRTDYLPRVQCKNSP